MDDEHDVRHGSASAGRGRSNATSESGQEPPPAGDDHASRAPADELLSESASAAHEEHLWVREISDFEAMQDLEAASTLMRRNLFGGVAKIRLPFSTQLLTEIENAFPVDGDMFKAVAQSHREYRRGYQAAFVLGTIVFGALLAVWVAFASEYLTLVLDAAAFQSMGHAPWFFTDEGAPNLIGLTFGGPLWLYALLFFIAIACAGIAARFLLRFLLLREIGNNARDLDNTITQRYELILARVLESCSKISSARSKDHWSRRAHHWSIVAQWNAKRAEYIDRYFSTIGWKIWLFNTVWELLYAGLRLALIVAAHIWLLAALNERLPDQAQSTLYLIVFGAGAVFTAYAAYFWFFWDRKANTTWGDVAAANVKATERGHVHEWERLAEAVETLVKTIMDVQAR